MKLFRLLAPLLLFVMAASDISVAINVPRQQSASTPDRPRLVQQAPADQVIQKNLTNDDVVKMITGGLSEVTIIQVIRKGPTDFDTSPDALIKLKENGASPRIIEAMLGPVSSTAGVPARGEAVSGRGVFVQSASEWKRIEEVSSVEVRSVGNIAHGATLGIKEQRVICVFRGEKAERQLNERRPVFHVAGLGASARDVYIVELRLNPDRRDLEVGRSGLVKKLSFGFRKRDVHDVDVKRLGEDLLEVTPRQDLEPGEYIMVLGGVRMLPNASAGAEGTTGYDFGIGRTDVVRK
jgi:hypothetical protein